MAGWPDTSNTRANISIATIFLVLCVNSTSFQLSIDYYQLLSGTGNYSYIFFLIYIIFQIIKS